VIASEARSRERLRLTLPTRRSCIPYDLENDLEERATIKPGERTDEQQRLAQTLMEVIQQHTRQDASDEL
jgi:hypothetical protein